MVEHIRGAFVDLPNAESGEREGFGGPRKASYHEREEHEDEQRPFG